jgi:hypothetical protein
MSETATSKAPSCSATVEIDAPADRLFAMVSDISRMGEYSPENAGGTWLKGADGPSLGAHFRGKQQASWRIWWTGNEIVELEQDRLVAWRTTVGPLKVGVWRYRFDPSADGARTTVTEEWVDERMGFMKTGGWIASGVKDRDVFNQAGIEETLAAIKAAAEGHPVAGQ